MKIIYDLKKLVSVKIVDKRSSLDLFYREYIPKKHWWNKERLEGFYDSYTLICNEDAPPIPEIDLVNGKYDEIKYIVENKVAYFKPYVKLSFINGDIQIINCDTYDEAKLISAAYIELGIDIPYEFS